MKISNEERKEMVDEALLIFLSVASTWEINQKSRECFNPNMVKRGIEILERLIKDKQNEF